FSTHPQTTPLSTLFPYTTLFRSAFNTRRPITSSYVENNNNAFHLLGQIFYYVFIEARLHHRRDTMIATAITYAVLAFSGLIGSAIAWEDLRKATRKPAAKQS